MRQTHPLDECGALDEAMKLLNLYLVNRVLEELIGRRYPIEKTQFYCSRTLHIVNREEAY